MENLKHTKGEWVAEDITILSKELGKSIGTAYLIDFKHDNRGRSIPDKQGRANAKLFAASSDMLQDLIDTFWLVDNGATHEELIERISLFKKTIEKATNNE